jgi:penicillin-binding protein-related factor A (putative recombinase)
VGVLERVSKMLVDYFKLRSTSDYIGIYIGIQDFYKKQKK